MKPINQNSKVLNYVQNSFLKCVVGKIKNNAVQQPDQTNLSVFFFF